MAGRSSDLLGRACVCCVCMCWWSLFTSSVSLHSYPLSSPVQLITTFSFLAGAALLKKVSYFSIHSSHSLFSIPVVTTNSLFLSLCSLLVELLDSWGLSTTKTVLFLFFFFFIVFYFNFFSFLLYFFHVYSLLVCCF